MKNKYKISEDRILQISNDISEDMCKATNKELIEVVKYFRDELDGEILKKNNIRTIVTSKQLEILNEIVRV